MMIERMRALLKDEEGATMVEYALVVALIAVVAMIAVRTLGDRVSGTFEEVEQEMAGAGEAN